MHHEIFNQLSLVIAIGVVVSLVMRLLRQPLIMSYILTGIVVGPSMLGILDNTDTLAAFSTIGITLLLFIIGLGLNAKVIKDVGKVVLVAGAVQLVATTLITLGTAVLLGFSFLESLFVAVGLSFSSTIIVIKLLNDRREQARLYGKIAIGILLVQDLAATVALLFLAAGHNGESISVATLLWLVLKGSLLVGVIAFVTTRILPKFPNALAGSQEFLFLFALGWGMGIATLFEAAGFSLEVGALIAGISLAHLPYCQEISARLKPLRDFFIVVFFISLGGSLVFDSIHTIILPAILFSLIAIFIKPLIALMAIGFMGYTRNTSFRTTVVLGQISEFSIIFVVLGYHNGYIGQDITALITLVALITIATSTYMTKYADQLFEKLERFLTPFEYRMAESEQHVEPRPYRMVLFGYRKGGIEFIRLFKKMGKPFVVVDYDPEAIEALEQQKVHYLYGDATDLELLREANIEKAKLIVSTITDHQTSLALVRHITLKNPRAVVVCHSDNLKDAEELYELGASYVMLPHYIGSEKITSFISRNGFSKTEFRHWREKNLTKHVE